MIKDQFNVNGLQSTSYFKDINKFKPMENTFIQILFQGDIKRIHWVTVSNIFGCENNEIKL
jgi:hypothetical protein